MSDEEKLLKMFTDVHGEATGSCYVEIVEDEYTGDVLGINMMKDGNLCWFKSKTDIVFDYITKEW